MGYVKVLGQNECTGGTARNHGEKKARRRRCKRAQDRQVGVCLHLQDNGKSLRGFKPGNDTVKFPFPEDCSHCRGVPDWRKAGGVQTEQLETIAKVLMSRVR